MSATSIPVRSAETGPIRPLNILRDLPAVADLIDRELFRLRAGRIGGGP